MFRPLVLAAAAALTAATALAGVEVEVGNGDKITGTLNPPLEVETFRFRVPKGAVVTAKAKAATKGLVLDLDLEGPGAVPLGAASASAAAITGVTATASGVHTLRVRSHGGLVTGNYSLAITWKSPKSYGATAELAAAATGGLPFAAEAGAVATLEVKPARGSSASPVLTSLTLPDAGTSPLTGTKAARTLAAGDHVLTFTNQGAATGGVAATVKLKAPKPSKRKIALTASVIGSGTGGSAVAAVVGPEGGTVTFPTLPSDDPGAVIAGSAVTIPPGALGAGTAIVVATAPQLDLPGDGDPAGPPVHFGPDGLTFTSVDKDARALVTIPYVPSAATDELVIYTRDAKGKITAVPRPYSFDAGAKTVTFATAHFSSFQVGAPGGIGGDIVLLTSGTATTPRDVCVAFDASGSTTPIEYFVAEGPAKTVAAMQVNLTNGLLDRVRWAGGGSGTADDGTVARLDFQFPEDVVSVQAIPDGSVFVATTTRIYQVDENDFVTRVAGTGNVGDSGDGGDAKAATFTSIRAILAALDGSLFIADGGAHKIRAIPANQGNVIQPLAGNGATAVTADGVPLAQTTFLGPDDMEFAENGGLYVADVARVRLVKLGIPSVSPDINITIAGDVNGQTGSTGDGGPLLAARFQKLSGIATYIDISNPTPTVPNLVVCDEADHTVRVLDRTHDRVVLAQGQHGVAGDAPQFAPADGLLNNPGAIANGIGLIVFVDRGNAKIRTRLPLQLQ